MIVAKTKRVKCGACGKRMTIRQYEGTGGAWYVDAKHYAKCVQGLPPWRRQ